jgi:hypothetical protein
MNSLNDPLVFTGTPKKFVTRMQKAHPLRDPVEDLYDSDSDEDGMILPKGLSMLSTTNSTSPQHSSSSIPAPSSSSSSAVVSVGGSRDLIQHRFKKRASGTGATAAESANVNINKDTESPTEARPSLTRAFSFDLESSFVSRGSCRTFNTANSLDCESTHKRDNAGDAPLCFIATLIEDFQWAFTDLGWRCTEDHSIRSHHHSTNKNNTTSSNNNNKSIKRAVLVERKLKVEKWAVFVDSSLTVEGRDYHGLAHVFEMTESASSIQMIAAAFRDVIRFSASVTKAKCKNTHSDNYVTNHTWKLTTQQQELLGDFISTHPNNLSTLQISDKLSNPADLIICTIFGYKPGDVVKTDLPAFQKFDVFLSTIVAARLLQEPLSLAHVAQLAAVLRATIPFHSNNDYSIIHHKKK